MAESLHPYRAPHESFSRRDWLVLPGGQFDAGRAECGRLINPLVGSCRQRETSHAARLEIPWDGKAVQLEQLVGQNRTRVMLSEFN
jgi:hypothetical protein